MEIILSQNCAVEWKQRKDFVFHFLLDYSYNSTKPHCLNSGKQIAGNCSTPRSFMHPVYQCSEFNEKLMEYFNAEGSQNISNTKNKLGVTVN